MTSYPRIHVSSAALVDCVHAKMQQASGFDRCPNDGKGNVFNGRSAPCGGVPPGNNGKGPGNNNNSQGNYCGCGNTACGGNGCGNCCGNFCNNCGGNCCGCGNCAGNCYGNGYQNSMYDQKGGRWDEPRFSGWTQAQWANWVQTPHGVQWTQNKRREADVLVEWLINTWGFDYLRGGGGVIDVGGEPGFVAASLLERGVPATIVDPSWGLTGKANWNAPVWQYEKGPVRFGAFREMFDSSFVERHGDFFKGVRAIVSLYGDEATVPCIEIAANTGKPCAVVPCNECVKFFPPANPTYDGYVQWCLTAGHQLGGRLELAHLYGAPFSRELVVQSPHPEWADAALRSGQMTTLSVPVHLLQDLGVLHQLLWKMEVGARRTS